jgi:hypothetical protein
MGKLVSGVTSTTATKLLLGAGAFFKNYDPTTDTPATASEKLIGATQGGGSFSAVPTVRKIEIDGVKGSVKGMQVIDEWVVTLVSNVKEISVDAIKLALGVATSETSTSPTGYTKITANSDIATGDYLTNLTWVGTLSGSDKPVIIVVKNALSINGLSLAVADKNEAVIPITVTGNYDADDLEEAPFDIYYPTAA